MYWYKVKNMLIIMFVIINLFLITFIVRGHILRHKEISDKKSALITALTQSNVSVDEHLLSDKTATVPTASAENLIPLREKLPETFLGKGYETITEGDLVKYKKDGKVVYTSHGQIFYSDENLKSDISLNEKSVDDANARLSEMGFDMSHATATVVGDFIMYTYKLHDKNLFGSSLSIKMSGDKISGLEGYIIGIYPEKGSSADICSPSDILVSFIRDEARPSEKQTVKSITLGYSLLMTDSSVNFKNTETIPTYKIVTDKNDVFFYDARQ